MSGTKKRRVENVVASIQQQYGPLALQPGRDLGAQRLISHIPTSFPQLDALTGCGGIPSGRITLVSGRSTSGKVTLAYKILASAQYLDAHRTAPNAVALLDMSRTADPDYVARCGVDLDALLVGQPPAGRKALELLGDLLRRPGIRALVVDSLSEIAGNQEALRTLLAMLPHFQQMVQERRCALIILDEPHAPWMRWLQLDASSPVRSASALHIELQHEQWIYQREKLVGYRAQARLLKSRWVNSLRSTQLEIIFNGTVKSRETW